MNWTTDKPTKPGQYWHKRPWWNQGEHVFIDNKDGELWVRWKEAEIDDIILLEFSEDSQWCPAVVNFSEMKKEVAFLQSLMWRVDSDDWREIFKESVRRLQKMSEVAIDMSK